MLQELKRYLPKGLLKSHIPEKEAGAAYDLWSANYDNQPGNLMLDLDEKLFSHLLEGTCLEGKKVADIGCGTGRHWAKILQQHPHSLAGFDVSAGMLHCLVEKFPQAEAHLIDDDRLPNIPTDTFDVITSTLTVAHMENLEQALLAWCRVLKTNSEILITDFHPSSLAIGGKRTFKYGNGHIAVRNFVHTVQFIKDFLSTHHYQLLNEAQLNIDETVKHYYKQQQAMHVYKKFEGMPIIYGLHFKRGI